MKVVERPSLQALNSFGLPAMAALLVELESEEELLSLPAFDPRRDCVLGGGSNVVFVGDVPGTVYRNSIPGRALVEDSGDEVLLEVGAGEDWHQLVRWTLAQGLSGLENLSLIPGRVGAAPIQNIGAYGVELSSLLESVTAWEWQQARWVCFSADDCQLAYRDSRFKSREPDRYLITSIRLRLRRRFRPVLEYAGLREELAAMDIREPSARDVSDAVIRIRRRKLPDPAENGNAGSFFKNPLVSAARAEQLQAAHPGLVSWPTGDGTAKLSAAWLIEKCGLKGERFGDAAVSKQHALVLLNRGAATGADVAALARRIQARVADEFGVPLEPEPRLFEFSA